MRTLLVTLHSKFIHPSLALPYLAAFCREDCGELQIREFTVHEPKETVLAALLAEQPDVIAFSVYLWNRRETLELVDALAVVRPDLRLVLGGPEVSFDGPELFHRHPGLTALVRGEGELPLHALLGAWHQGREPEAVPRLDWRQGPEIQSGGDGPQLATLDAIPSPFSAGLVETGRGFVYYETSRGCPYACAFCMSALDEKVRSFSMARIEADLAWLLERRVPKIKLVDRTFNYDAARARRIWRFILEHNRDSHLHFEIGAQLLDEESLELLEQVPEGMFQFEIGIQSTLPQTLSAIDRRVDLQKLLANVAALRQRTAIHLHLDLIAGLPGESRTAFLTAIDQVLALRPHHLQVEPVKLLPGSPLRRDAGFLGLSFDPNPPYSVLQTPELSFADLQRLGAISRLLDLSLNCGRLQGLLARLSRHHGSTAAALDHAAEDFLQHQRLRHPLSQRGIFETFWAYVQDHFQGEERETLREALGRDFARCERVVPHQAPAFFELELNEQEKEAVRRRVRTETEALRGQGIKLQHFAALFHRLEDNPGRQVLLFLYLTRSGGGQEVREVKIKTRG